MGFTIKFKVRSCYFSLAENVPYPTMSHMLLVHLAKIQVNGREYCKGLNPYPTLTGGQETSQIQWSLISISAQFTDPLSTPCIHPHNWSQTHLFTADLQRESLQSINLLVQEMQNSLSCYPSVAVWIQSGSWMFMELETVLIQKQQNIFKVIYKAPHKVPSKENAHTVKWRGRMKGSVTDMVLSQNQDPILLGTNTHKWRKSPCPEDLESTYGDKSAQTKKEFGGDRGKWGWMDQNVKRKQAP